MVAVTMRNTFTLEQFISRDMDLCLWFNRASRYHAIRRSFAVVSWLGDGKFWYSIMLALLIIIGEAGLYISLHMAYVALIGLLIYKIIKSNTHRLRPYMTSRAITLGASPLDRYSFPSGHTLHAVSFTIILTSYFPTLVWILMPFTLLIALSRVILGLHYPSDVGIGALIGFMLATASLQF